MPNRLRSLALLTAGFVIGAVISGHYAFPMGDAQTESDAGNPPSQQAAAPKDAAAPKESQHTIFPATEDPEVARVYATAYIVAEALRAGVIASERQSTTRPEDRVENLVRGVYRELGGR